MTATSAGITIQPELLPFWTIWLPVRRIPFDTARGPPFG
jgi:hypothetical protein